LGELRPAGLSKLRLSSAPAAVSFAPGQVPSRVRAATASSSLAPASRHRGERRRHERDSSETGERRKRKMGAERLRPSNSEGRSQPAFGGYIPSGAAPLPPLPIQTAAGADRLHSAPAVLQPNTS
jgi:hypothetical protein